MTVETRAVAPADKPVWGEMRVRLWPSHDGDKLLAELDEVLANERYGVFVAVDGGRVVGFIECSLRETAIGCSTSPVGYVEGWYVAGDCRGDGVGRLLLDRGEEWARGYGVTEMASDTTSEYPLSPAAHRALGYEITREATYFRKDL